MSWYCADFLWPGCGEAHLVADEFQIERGPDRAGAVAELYGDGELPPALVELQRAKVWCDRAGAYVPMEDRARVVVTPRRWW